MDVMEAALARRSVRRFLDKDIPDEILAEIINAGRYAPSSGGASSFVFGIVKDDATKRALATVAGGQDWIATAPVVVALCGRLGADLAELPADDGRVRVNRARFGADLLAHLGAYPDRRAVRVLMDNGVPLIPGEHLALAATAYGLGSCWIGHLDTAAAGRILGLPDEMVCLFLMPIGYPDETPAEKTVRSIDECVFYDRWAD